jgi:hypothetical protein
MSTIESQAASSIPSALLESALALDEKTRVELANRLLDSVEDSTNHDPHGWGEGWYEELERRAIAVEQGAPTFTLEEVMSRARETIRKARDLREASAPTQ